MKREEIERYVTSDATVREENNARWRKEKNRHYQRCAEDIAWYQGRMDSIAGPGVFRVEMNSACQYYIVRVRDGTIITGNGKTGRTPRILEGMISFLRGATR